MAIGESVIRDEPGLVCCLRLVRRHSPSCIEKSESRECPGRKRCPLHVKGHINYQPVRKSLGTRNIQVAYTAVDDIIDRHLPGCPTIDEAVERFLRDKAVQTNVKLRDGADWLQFAVAESETVRKYNDVLSRLRAFAASHHVSRLDELSAPILADFRETWKGKVDHTTGLRLEKSPVGKQKYQELLKTFFKWAQGMGFITTNPAARLSRIVAPRSPKPRRPYTADEVKRILAAIPAEFPKIGGRVRAFMLVVMTTSLRLGDVVGLRRDAVNADAIVCVMEKTGQYIRLPLATLTRLALEQMQPTSAEYFFWTGRGKLETAKTDWSEKVLRVYRRAGVELRSHAFRDTAATHALAAGSTMETASALLGHSDVRVTQKHYEHWDDVRQQMLTEAFQENWKRLQLDAEDKPNPAANGRKPPASMTPEEEAELERELRDLFGGVDS